MINFPLKLVEMTPEQFGNFLNSQISEYAQQKIANQVWEKAEAINRARAEFSMLLPDGLDTYNNFLFTIQDQANTVCGYLWLGEVVDGDQPEQPFIFIYDFTILAEYQHQGLANPALQLAQEWALSHNYQQIGLHVFGQNTIAQKVYQQAGFVPIDITMKKNLTNHKKC